MSMSTNPYLTSLSENATRFGMRLQETISEHTRELGLGVPSSSSAAGVMADGAGGVGLDEKTQAQLKKQLDGSSDREKLDAMRRLVGLISKNRNVSTYFASVVKNVASANMEVRKLVYIYLLHYASYEPDLALLSINTFQRDLADANPLIRAMALRVLSGMGERVPVVGSIVVLGVEKCARDPSAYVRKAAGLSIPKCFALDSAHHPALIKIITNHLLAEKSPLALGAVAVAFQAICPPLSTLSASSSSGTGKLDLLHPHFRRLCRLLIDIDEWGQVLWMGLLLRYVRVMCARPVWGVRGVDDDETGSGSGNESKVEKPIRREGEEEGEGELDKDVKLLLDSVLPVFQSRNPAVILAATRVVFYAGPPSYWTHFVGPLLRLLSTSREVERVVLVDILLIVRNGAAAHLFSPHYTRFLARSDDLGPVKKDKIKLLLSVVGVDSWAGILREFVDYADDVDDGVVGEAIDAIGKLAMKISESVTQCLSALMGMIRSRYDTVVSHAVMVLKYLVQTQLSTTGTMTMAAASVGSGNMQSPLSIIAHLARRIDDIKHAQARACVVWLVGQYAASAAAASSGSDDDSASGMASWAPDVLRKLAKTFAKEDKLVKLQVITLAAKLYILVLAGDGGSGGSGSGSGSGNGNWSKRIGMLCVYVLSQARYDLDWDVRDRGRMVGGLIAGIAGGEGAGIVNGGGGSAYDEVTRAERTGVVLRREQVKVVLFDGKEGVVSEGMGYLDDEKVLIGTMARVTGRNMRTDDEVLPDWLERGVESKLRDSEYDERSLTANVNANATAFGSSGGGGNGKTMVGFGGSTRGSGVHNTPVVLTPTGPGSGTLTPGSGSGSGKGKFKDLDSFYADDDDESAVGEEEDGEEEEEEEGSDGDEEEEEEEDGSEDEEGSEEKEEEEETGDEREVVTRRLVNS